MFPLASSGLVHFTAQQREPFDWAREARRVSQCFEKFSLWCFSKSKTTQLWPPEGEWLRFAAQLRKRTAYARKKSFSAVANSNWTMSGLLEGQAGTDDVAFIFCVAVSEHCSHEEYAYSWRSTRDSASQSTKNTVGPCAPVAVIREPLRRLTKITFECLVIRVR